MKSKEVICAWGIIDKETNTFCHYDNGKEIVFGKYKSHLEKEYSKKYYKIVPIIIKQDNKL